MTFDLRSARILLTGGGGFLGQRVQARLLQRGASVVAPRRAEYDLTEQSEARRLLANHRPELVIHLAAEVGGIGANRSNPGRFFYANLAMGLHLVEASRQYGVAKFVQVGTVCSYPRLTPVPFEEERFWDGYPEETNAPYGIAKKALLTMLQGYRKQYGLNGIYLIPVNLYGPGDNFDLDSSHVIPALIRKFYSGRREGRAQVTVWGTGSASREFLHVADAARAIVMAAEMYDQPEPVNIGSGVEITIKELVATISRLTRFVGEVQWDNTKPDGQPRRRLDTSRARRLFGFEAGVELEVGLKETIAWWEAQGIS